MLMASNSVAGMNVNGLAVGKDSSNPGTATLAGSAIFYCNNAEVAVGVNGSTGNLTLSGSAWLTTDKSVAVGGADDTLGGTGTMILNGGSSFTQTGGSEWTWFNIGRVRNDEGHGSAVGTLEVHGDATFAPAGWVFVGLGGEGHLDIDSTVPVTVNGRFTIADGGEVVCDAHLGGSAALIVTGTGGYQGILMAHGVGTEAHLDMDGTASLTNSNDGGAVFQIGASGTGYMTMAGGTSPTLLGATVANNTAVWVGSVNKDNYADTPGAGNLAMSEYSKWEQAGDLSVGKYGGAGDVTVQDNAHFVQTSGTAFVIGADGGTGTWKQSGGLTETTNTVILGQSIVDLPEGKGTVNLPGSGTLQLDGGTFQAPGIATGSTISGNESATLAEVDFNGGILQATGNNADFIANTTGATLALKVQAGGAKIDTNGNAITITQALSGDAAGRSLEVMNSGSTAGVLTLTGPITNIGPTKVDAGATLVIQNGSATTLNTTLASVTGRGSLVVANGTAATTLTVGSIRVGSLSLGGAASASAVPEPGTLALLAIALTALAGGLWSKRTR